MFQVAAASVLGRDHIPPGKNNQDAFYVLGDSEPDYKTTIAVVCDGCGSGAHSEVGAKIGARLIAEEIRSRLPWFPTQTIVQGAALSSPRTVEKWIENVRQTVLARLRVLAMSMGRDFAETIQDYFLFTVVGAVVGPTISFTFNLGDGVAFVNGERQGLGTYEGNAPPYLGYSVLDFDRPVHPDSPTRFTVNTALLTRNLNSLLIGTDGVEMLLANAETRMPGKAELVGDVSRLWIEDRFFKNADNLRRYLTLVNREHVVHDWDAHFVNREVGCLKDDTTIVVIRRGPAS